MSTFLIVLILIASVLMILAVLVQNPKSGMASNFGASNQVMGVRQTADFLEKFTWGAAVVILALSLVFTIFLKGDVVKEDIPSEDPTEEALSMPQSETPAVETQSETEAPAPAAETEKK